MVRYDEAGKAIPHPDNGGWKGEGGPPNSLRTEYVAPVSKRKEIDFIDTRMSTWSSLSEMTVVGTREPGFLQSSMARP